jgi:hypothetical protein
MTYLPTQKKFDKFFKNNLTSQMVHYSLVKMTNQLVFTLLVKKTTPITLDI